MKMLENFIKNLNENETISLEPFSGTKISDDTALCREIQQLLKGMNLYRGKVDGIYGGWTREAIQQFKIKQNIPTPDIFTLQTAQRMVEIANLNKSTQNNSIAKQYPNLNTPQGTQDAIIEECKRQGLNLKPQIAYVLATVQHETNNTYMPVKEAYYLGPQRAEPYRKKLSYFPYYGRGYAQLTHNYNYHKYSKILKQDFLTDPDNVLDPVMSLFILVHGMMNGAFTAKRLDNYVNHQKTDFLEARRVINGKDKAQHIADLAQIWLSKI